MIISNSATRNASINYLNDTASLNAQIAQCADLTLRDRSLEIKGSANNKLEVHGNLTITASGTLDMNDSSIGTPDGQLYLEGNWTNETHESNFNQGESTVHFTGTTTQTINAVIPEGTETFYHLVLDNHFSTGISNNLIAQGNLTIAEGKTLIVSENGYVEVAKRVLNNGTLTIKDNGSLIQLEDEIANIGSITMERIASIRLSDYVYWSAPVTDFSVRNLSTNTPASGIFKWNPIIANSNNGLGNWQNTSENMIPGIGYIVRGPNNFNDTTIQDYKASFIGLPNNGIYNVAIQRGSYTSMNYTGKNGIVITNNDDNWNLIGNPYPSALEALAFLNANPNIEGAVRLWTHGSLPNSSNLNSFYGDFKYNYSAEDYLVHNGTATLSGPSGFNGYIGAGQSFFVLMNDGVAATEQVVFSNAMRSRLHHNNQFYRSEALPNEKKTNEKHRIWLDLIAPSKTVTRTAIGYLTEATLEKDRLYDAFTDYSNPQNFYSLINTAIVSIQGRPLPFTTEDTVPLGVKIPSSGNYTIAIAAVDGLFSNGNQTLYLEDTELNVVHNLSVNPYSFSIDKGITNNRFVLRYTTASLDKKDFEILSNQIDITTKNDKIEIHSKKDPLKEIVVFDSLGRTLQTQDNINSLNALIPNVVKNNPFVIVQIRLLNGQTITHKIMF